MEIVANPVDIMCNCYGSHVLRRLLCLCKGAPAYSLEFHSTKPSIVLAERLNMRSSNLDSHELHQSQPFPDQLKFLMSELLNPSRTDIAVLQKNQYSSLVLQTALKLLAGEEELSLLIPVLLGCRTDNVSDGDFVVVPPVKKILRLVEDNAYSHLLEHILLIVAFQSFIDIEAVRDKIVRRSHLPTHLGREPSMAFLFLHKGREKREAEVRLGLEAHPFGQIVDPEAIANSHYELLAPYVGGIEKAKRAIFYSYNCFYGFATLIDKGVATDIAQNSNVIWVFITGKCTCQTTYSWDFLGLGNKGKIPKASLWQKTLGEDVIIANVDTGV
ncbi:hypothetical protein OROHE_018656 [Orobanche hederae]